MRRIVKSLVLVGWLFPPAMPAQGQPITILHTFTGGVGDGQNPDGSLLLSGSNLVGMTFGGGTVGDGTIFKIGTSGTGYGVMHSFAGLPNDGSNPHGSLIQVGAAQYGMTEGGGSANAGTIFRVGADGTGLTLLHQFVGGASDGSQPLGTLLLSGSTFYGVTNSGGSANFGTIFKIGTDGTGFSLLHSFAGAPGDGQLPGSTTLVQSGSTLYGMTSSGGSANHGTIFKIGTDGSAYSVLHSFAGGVGDGQIPAGSLILSGSALYGMTDLGGAAGAGTIFRIGTDGSGFGLVHSFAGGPFDGANPHSDLIISGSALFGMTAQGGSATLGTLFGVGTDGSGYMVMHSFAGGPGDGANPEGALILSGSTLYGMTSIGGGNNDGVVFSFPIAVPEPSSLMLAGSAAGALALLARRWTKRCRDGRR